MGNVRAMTLAYLMYAEEADQHTVPGYVVKTKRLWFHNLEPYARDIHIFECPSVKTTATYEKSGGPIGYGMNNFLNAGVDLDAVDQPAELIALGDDEDDTKPGWYPMMDWDTRSTGDNASPPSQRHSGGGNMGFCDGHAEWFKYQDLGYRDGVKHPEPPGKDYWRPKNVEATP
jgi:prepilin-type processing-associated H-X9-DG protein